MTSFITHTPTQLAFVEAVITACAAIGTTLSPDRILLVTERTARVPGGLFITAAPCGCAAGWRPVGLPPKPRVVQRMVSCPSHPLSMDLIVILRRECEAIIGEVPSALAGRSA